MSAAFAVTEMDGLRALVELLPLPDDAPDDVREGVVRRRLVATTGECPCGARRPTMNREQRRQLARDQARGRANVWVMRVEHEDGCPAVDETLIDAIRRWRA